MADEKRTFQPAPAGTNRGRQQGLGVGQRELDLQGDPAGNARGVEGVSDNPQKGWPEEDWGEPADEGAAYSSNHANRGTRRDEENSQGRKTREATKDQISRRL